MLLLALVAIFMLLGIVQPAHAMEVGVHDQGAATSVLVDVAENLGAGTVRIISRPGEPHLDQVRVYREYGLKVQAAILLKRQSTPNDVRQLMRAWHGQVRSVSVGNEPELNGLTPCAYASLYRRSYALIRREFPGTRVGFGEFSPTDPIGYTTKVLACGQGGRDASADHDRPDGAHRSARAVARPQRARGRGRAAAGTGERRDRSASRGETDHPRGVQGRSHRTLEVHRRLPRPIRADFWAVHPYQFHSDPLGPPAAERAMGAGIPSWMGIGSLGAAHRFLRANRHRISTPGGKTLPVACTEFQYLISGGYATTLARAAWMMPRMIRQARKWCSQLIVYGLGEVFADSNWGSACLLDGFGQPTIAFAALAGALGRTLRIRKPAEPPVVVRTPLPDLSDTRPPLAPVLVEHGEAASTQPEPEPAQDPAPPADEPPAPPPSDPSDPTSVEPELTSSSCAMYDSCS